MKKIYAIIAALTLSALMVEAQAPLKEISTVGFNLIANGPGSNGLINIPGLNSPADLGEPYGHSATRSSSRSAWLCYAFAADSFVQATYGTTTFTYANGAIDYMFPDSLPLAAYGSYYLHPSVVSQANIFDPYAKSMRDYYGAHAHGGFTIATSTGYHVDSMGYVFAYVRRNKNKAEVDTLLSVTMTDSIATNIYGFWKPLKIIKNKQASTDTIQVRHVPILRYTNLYNSTIGNGAKFRKIPLTAADSGFRFKKWGVNMHVPAGGQVISSISYKPGALYKFGDTLNKHMNYILMYPNNEMGVDSTVDFYNPIQVGLNASPMATARQQAGWYHTHSKVGIYDSIYFSDYLFTTQNTHDAYFLYHIIADNTGVNNITGTLKNISVYPNPANSLSLLSFDVTLPGRVRVLIYDITGRIINEVADYNATEGEQRVKISTNNMANGLYMVSLYDATNLVTTQKLIVKH